MTPEDLITKINQLQITLNNAKEALQKTNIPTYAVEYYILEETGVNMSNVNIKIG